MSELLQTETPTPPPSPLLFCVDCGKATTKLEATSRRFNVGACGFCGGELAASPPSAPREADTDPDFTDEQLIARLVEAAQTEGGHSRVDAFHDAARWREHRIAAAAALASRLSASEARAAAAEQERDEARDELRITRDALANVESNYAGLRAWFDGSRLASLLENPANPINSDPATRAAELRAFAWEQTAREYAESIRTYWAPMQAELRALSARCASLLEKVEQLPRYRPSQVTSGAMHEYELGDYLHRPTVLNLSRSLLAPSEDTSDAD